jgi:hypothetical protein
MLSTTTSKTVAVGRFGGCGCLGELFEVRVDLVASRSFNLMAEPDGHCREGVSSRNRSCACESPTLRRAWLNRSVGSSKRVWIRCRRYRVRRGRWVRCGSRIHSSTRQRFRFERSLDRRRWGRLEYRRSRCWWGRWPNRCVGGIGCSSWGGMGHRVRSGPYARASSKARRGYRGSYSETNLPVDYVLVVLLAHDQGAQYADDGHRDHQTGQQELIRTRPPKIHLTPPARARES